jgi:O-antigen ligase
MSLQRHPGLMRFALFLLPFSLPLARNASTVPMLFLIFVWLLQFPPRDILNSLRKEALLLIISTAIFFVSLAGMMYTDYFGLGWNEVLLKLPLLILPVLFISLKHKRIDWKPAAYGQIVGVSVAGVICIGNALLTFLQTGQSQFFYKELVEPLWIHPGYLSMYVLLSIFLLGRLVYRNRKAFSQINFIAVPLLIFLLGFMFLLAGRMQILIGVILGNLYLITFFVVKRRIAAVVLMMMLNGLMVFGLSQLDFVAMRFYYLRNPEFSFDQEGKWNGTQMRLAIWTITLEEIRKEPVLGSGTGSAQPVLQKAYQEKNFALAEAQQYNNHNQYLQQWMTNGISGLLSFLLLIGGYFFQSIRRRHWLQLFVVSQIALSSLTESVLQTQSGVVYLAFWLPLLLIATNEVTSKDESL